MSNISHVGNISLNIRQYYRVSIALGSSDPDTILLIYIEIDLYLKPCAEYNFTTEWEVGTT